jgi:hypothetical protein
MLTVLIEVSKRETSSRNLELEMYIVELCFLKEYLGRSNFEKEDIDMCNLEEVYLKYFIE